jgi:hypothetical protein
MSPLNDYKKIFIILRIGKEKDKAVNDLSVRAEFSFSSFKS